MTESEQASIDTLFKRIQQLHRPGQAIDADMFRHVQEHFRKHPEAGYYLVRDILSLQASVCALREVVARARAHFTAFQESREAGCAGKGAAVSATSATSGREHDHGAHPAKAAAPHGVPNASLAARHLQQRLNRSPDIQG
ncbi:DUF2076 family protein [Corticibacter populi]|uniref:DUF2076 family protein n=1 Tax=Corticibacter populi TaxID=1550736 RepID=A0A3M6QZK4_9BURK|nr:DUF2076 family protein [Corticibacter populi]RMX08381.1 DUF2076 family protein [Corticibacter populi]RZS35682.1 uncharacterized protein DUF2076 [Corticibacter populi]